MRGSIAKTIGRTNSILNWSALNNINKFSHCNLNGTIRLLSHLISSYNPPIPTLFIVLCSQAGRLDLNGPMKAGVSYVIVLFKL